MCNWLGFLVVGEAGSRGYLNGKKFRLYFDRTLAYARDSVSEDSQNCHRIVMGR